MYSNVTNFTTFDLFNLKPVERKYASAFYAVTLSSSVINASSSSLKCFDFGSNLEKPEPPNTFLHSARWIGFH